MIILRSTPATKRHIKNLSYTEHSFNTGLRNALFDIGQLATFKANTMINSGGRTGRVYFINGSAHQASAPGEAPANLTGKLAKSLNYDVHGVEEVQWGSTINYGRWLEEGTRKMRPRPSLSVVHGDMAGVAEVYLGGRVDDAIKRRS